MTKSLEDWKSKTLGRKIDLDNQSFDCVDVSKSWAEYLTDKPWVQSLSWGNAKDLYANNPGVYWSRIAKGNQPVLGDVVVMNGTIGGGFGHTGVVVGIEGGDIIIYQQNTFTQQSVYIGRYSWNASYITGFLRSKIVFSVGAGPVLQGYQRVLGGDVTFYRQAPNRSAALLKTDTIPDGKLKPGDTYDFKGFVRGENVDGNNIWFVGKHSSGFAHSSGFTDTGTHDLADLTPASVLGPTQRQVGSDVMNYRRTPQVAPDNVIRQISAGEVLTMNGWIKGMAVDGNDTWFRHESGYIWSGGFVDKGVHDLTQIVIDVVAPPPPPPVPSPSYTFNKDLVCVTQVKPAGEGSFERGNFPATPAKAIVHDFGTEGKDTLATVVPWFQKKDNISAHFAVEGKEIVQFVKLGDRAYHAGPNGNMYVGIETSPKQDKDTIESTRILIQQLEAYYAKSLVLVKHSEIMPTQCGDDIDLSDYDIHTPVTVDGKLEARISSLEESQSKVVDFLSKTFKEF